MQPQTPNYETPQQHRDFPPPDEAERKLGSAQPDSDPFDAAPSDPAGFPAEYVAPERRPSAVVPADGIPVETQPTNFMTPERRPQDFRPREVFTKD